MRYLNKSFSVYFGGEKYKKNYDKIFGKKIQVIIIGGGRSIKEGIELGLWTKIKDLFTIGTNYSFKYFIPTILTFADVSFYKEQLENLRKLPCILVGNARIREHKLEELPNLYLLPVNNTKYTRDLSDGVYKGITGIFALSLAIYILDNLEAKEKEIFLLGMDWGNIVYENDKVINNFSVSEEGVDKINPKNVIRKEKGYRILTHFYDGELYHRGSGKVDYYITHNPEIIFSPYKDIKDIRIWNVSPKSHIPTFPKIDYPTFFRKLVKCSVNVEEVKKILERIRK